MRPAEAADALSVTDRSCDAYRPEPDLALFLEVADLINQKRANSCVDWPEKVG